MRTGTTSRSAIAPTMPHMDGELLLGTDDCKRRAATGLAGATRARQALPGKPSRARVRSYRNANCRGKCPRGRCGCPGGRCPRPGIDVGSMTCGWHAYCALQPHEAFGHPNRSEEHTSELQSLMRTSYAVFCLKQN